MVCEFCGGSGEHPLIPDMECDICYGQGKIGQSIEVALPDIRAMHTKKSKRKIDLFENVTRADFNDPLFQRSKQCKEIKRIWRQAR